MSIEERFLDALEDEEYEEMLDRGDWWESQRHRLERKNQATIGRFLGKGRRTNTVGILPAYYGGLLAWALHQHLDREKWQTITTLGYQAPEPVYTDIDTDYNNSENCLINGQMLIEKGNSRFVVTVDIKSSWRSSVQVESTADKKDEAIAFIDGIMTIAREENFYRGKKIEFSGRIRFLNAENKSWDSIVLDAATKAEIKANTVDFLKKGDEWSKYGIPLKRGILLTGAPGTGKTAIVKALTSEADGITCITTNSYKLAANDYFPELYKLSKDLSPSLVFIEDIDLIGQSRLEPVYDKDSAFVSLLNVLDGVEQYERIVTVATTNYLEMLDSALSQRPSRFDRVIKLSRPSVEQRRELIRHLCQRIPLPLDIQEYIACKTDNCTPAQMQEIVYSLIIQSPPGQSALAFSKTDTDRAISRVNGKNREQFGFVCLNHHSDILEKR